MLYRYIFVLFLIYTMPLFCQDTTATERHFGIYTGVGWLHYIDNMVRNVGYEPVTELNFACPTIKFMWEPEHRLSFGLETGFYRMYEIGYFWQEANKPLVADCVPIFININIDLGKNFYIGIGTGVAVLQNKINAYSSAFSYANYQFSLSYRYPLAKNWVIGGETHYIWIGKNNDNMLTLQALLGYKL